MAPKRTESACVRLLITPRTHPLSRWDLGKNLQNFVRVSYAVFLGGDFSPTPLTYSGRQAANATHTLHSHGVLWGVSLTRGTIR